MLWYGNLCVFGRYYLYTWHHLVEGPSRSRGRAPPSEAVEAARSVGGEHVQLRVPTGEAVGLESAGLRGQALGQGPLADMVVSEMAQGMPLNAVH